jgi:hypothetical protein
MDDAVSKAIETAKRHPGRSLAHRQIAFSVILFFFATVLAWHVPLASLSLVALAALFLWGARDILSGTTQTAFIAPAYAATIRGERDLARALLDEAARRRPSARARRAIFTIRATLALGEADARGVATYATQAIEIAPAWIARDVDRVQIGATCALRALARATLGDDEGALADADRACTDGYASTSSLGTAELARALVAANRQQKDEVRAILTRAAPFFDGIGARERELAKRLSRYAATRARSIYRHAAKPEDGVDDWLAEPSMSRAGSVPPTAPPAVAAPAVKKQRAPSGRHFLVLAGVIAGAFSGLTLLDPSPVRPGPTDATRIATVFAVARTAMFYAFVARNLLVAARKRIARGRASILARRGDAQGIALLESQSRSGAPEASLALAEIAERESRFEDAIAQCDVGIGFSRATEVARMRSHDLVAPGLHAERAFCYAALGRHEEADAILASMPNAATYLLATAARLRVHVAQALVRGDRAGALAIARTRGDSLPLSTRDAFLVDLLEATEGRGADDEEWARLHAELAADPSLATWIDHFMPTRSLERRVAPPAPPDEESQESHQEPARARRD